MENASKCSRDVRSVVLDLIKLDKMWNYQM